MSRHAGTSRIGCFDKSGLALAALALTVTLLAAGCGAAAHTSAASPGSAPANKTLVPKVGGSLVVGVPTETPGWNPAINTWDDTGTLVGSTVLEPLATPGADSGAKPWLATSWIANTTFTRWVVQLRSGVRFQDGTPFNAQAVVANMDYYKTSPFYALTSGPLFEAVKALGDLTVEFDFTQPWAAFPSSFLDTQSIYIMAPAMIASGDHGSSHPIGTGPFTFSSWEPNSSFNVSRNPHYWGGLDAHGQVMRGTPYLNSIKFTPITDDGTRADALRTGDINMMSTTSAQAATSLSSSFTLIKDWDAGSVYVQLNTLPKVNGQVNPLANIHARAALAYATDQMATANLAGKGLQLASSPFGPATPWGMPTDQNGYVSYNLTKAKAEVAQYEKESGASSLTFTLMGVANLNTERALQVLAAQWQRAGITAHIQTLGQADRITETIKGGFQAAYESGYGFPDPDNEYYFWSTYGIAAPGGISLNFSQYATPQMDHDVDTGRQSGYPSIRRDAYHDLAKQINAGFTHIWLYYTPYSLVADRDVQGLATPQGPAHIPFGNFAPKTWWDQIWIS